MGLRNRIRRLEARLETDPERCPECNGKIVYIEKLADGTEIWPDGEEPCPTCNNIPPDGGIGKIVILLPGEGD